MGPPLPRLGRPSRGRSLPGAPPKSNSPPPARTGLDPAPPYPRSPVQKASALPLPAAIKRFLPSTPSPTIRLRRKRLAASSSAINWLGVCEMPISIQIFCVSSTSSSANSPRCRPLGSVNGPKLARFRRLTVRPTASHKRRISRLRPSLITTRHHSLLPPAESIDSIKLTAAGPSSKSTPASNFATISSVTSPCTRQRYSRSNSFSGCISFCANSPFVVKTNKPCVLISKRPTAIQREPRNLGSVSKTVLRPSGSWRVVTSPSGLL